MKLSIVATIYNDAEVVPLLVEECIKYISPLNVEYEIILVNDFSPDNSEEMIVSECKKNKNIKGVSLSRNFGQQIAMTAGMLYATGDYTLIMDGDLQNPTAEIPNLFNKIQEGYDMVFTVSKSRNNFRDEITSRLYWSLLTKILKVDMIKNQLMMRIMTKRFLTMFNSYSERIRTIEGIMADIGLNHTFLEVVNKKRTSGKSNYTFFSRFNLMLDIVISLSTGPLTVMVYFGFAIFSMTILTSIYYFLQFLFYNVTPGFTSIVLSIFFFGGIIIFLLGIIGRYLANIYAEVKNRPLVHVKKTINL